MGVDGWGSGLLKSLVTGRSLLVNMILSIYKIWQLSIANACAGVLKYMRRILNLSDIYDFTKPCLAFQTLLITNLTRSISSS